MVLPHSRRPLSGTNLDLLGNNRPTAEVDQSRGSMAPLGRISSLVPVLDSPEALPGDVFITQFRP